MVAARIEENLLFGVLAFQRGMISEAQFAGAAVRWSIGFAKPLVDHLVDEGSLSADDKRDLERDVARVLEKHGGDARMSLAMTMAPQAQAALQRIVQREVRQSMAGLSSVSDSQGFAPGNPTILPDPSAGQARQSRYSLIREYAQGGLGKVLIAFDNNLHRRVALKEIKTEWMGHDDCRRRFLKEAQITGQLEHPNIVPVYDLAHRPEDDQPYYAMRFVQGRTLGDAIDDYHKTKRAKGQDDSLSFRQLLDAFVSVCHAIAYAHSRGVIHRDLKPPNIVLGEFGVVVVLDWGLAKVLDQPDATEESSGAVFAKGIQLSEDSQTQTVGASGTPAYMAPEQAEGRNDLIDERTDVYGLGAILFEVLTGRPPVVERQAAEAMRQILARDTPRARYVNPDVSKTLDAICAKAMAKLPEDRYASAADLSEEVRRWLADEPVQVALDPWGVKVRRWIKKHPAWAAMAASVVLMLTLGLALFSGVQKRHNQQLQQANNSLDKANNDLTKANQLAESELDLAMEAIKSFHGEVTKDIVLNNPDMEKLRFRLLDVPLGFYARLAERLKQTNMDS